MFQIVAMATQGKARGGPGQPLLMIDCGQEALTAFVAQYGHVPMALFITHVHLDHVAGLERLFYKIYFDPERCGRVKPVCAPHRPSSRVSRSRAACSACCWRSA